MLTNLQSIGYAYLIVAKSAVGFESPSQGGHTATSIIRRFFCVRGIASPLGGYVGGFKPAGSLTRSLNPHSSPFFAFESAGAGFLNPLFKE